MRVSYWIKLSAVKQRQSRCDHCCSVNLHQKSFLCLTHQTSCDWMRRAFLCLCNHFHWLYSICLYLCTHYTVQSFDFLLSFILVLQWKVKYQLNYSHRYKANKNRNLCLIYMIAIRIHDIMSVKPLQYMFTNKCITDKLLLLLGIVQIVFELFMQFNYITHR